MKAATATLLVGGASAAVAKLRHPALRAKSAVLVERPLGLYGDMRCPCIGFDSVDGDTLVTLSNTTQVAFPADLGARCEAWDNKHHPDCKEDDEPDWCRQKWCYVDSCNCDLPVMPKMASYVPDALFQGKPVFFSYATCGSKDLWSDAVPKVGTAGCRCIGFDNIPGTIDIKLEDRNGKASAVSYPAEIGGTCNAWDDGVHPMCRGEDAPKWCKQRWCYVDPCSCKLDTAPKITMYLPDAMFTGMSLYYSYETCGSKDYFTEKFNTDACVNQDSKDQCLSLKKKGGLNKCAWTGKKCLGWELVEHPLCERFMQTVHNRASTPHFALAALAIMLGLSRA